MTRRTTTSRQCPVDSTGLTCALVEHVLAKVQHVSRAALNLGLHTKPTRIEFQLAKLGHFYNSRTLYMPFQRDGQLYMNSGEGCCCSAVMLTGLLISLSV